MSYPWGQWPGALTPADEREIWEWAAEEGELPSAYAVSGKLDIETCPMVKEPLRALRNPSVRSVVCMAGVQCLKTLIGELWLLWLILNDPGPTQWLQPDNEEAKEHARERFIPLIENYPAIHKKFTSDRFDRTTAFIRFAHMFLRIEGAHEKGNLQRKSIKNQMRSEVWQPAKWPLGRLKEADSRLTQFVHNSKTYTESQPGWAAEYNIDDMDGAFRAGDQAEITFACLSCSKRQPFVWSHKRVDGTRAGMRWDSSERTRRESGEWRWGGLAATVRYECMHCGHAHHDDPVTRRRMTASLEYVSANPDADPATRSFTWSQLAMPSLPWFETKIGGVKNFLIAHAKAKNGQDGPLRDFVMKVLAQPFNPARHAALPDMETIELSLLAEKPGKASVLLYEGIEFEHRLMAVDVQSDHFWALAEIWSAAGDSLTLDFQKLYSWEEVRGFQDRWKVLHEDVSVDISHRSHEVKTECSRSGRWVTLDEEQRAWVCWRALRGSDQPHFVWVPKTGASKGKRIQLPYTWPPEIADPCLGLPMGDPKRREFAGKRCQVITWSNPTVKDIAIARRDGRTKARNLIARGDWNDEFNRQMNSQRKVPAPAKFGGDRWRWEKFRDDHGLDCKCMCTVRASQRNLLQS